MEDQLGRSAFTTERFQLFTGCQLVGLNILGLSEDAAEIGLTAERIQTLAESRLRAVRVYDADVIEHSLLVSVYVVGPAFTLALEFRRWFVNPTIDGFGTVSSWRRIATGMHGGNAGYILQGLSEYLDRFILGYLRVNTEEAC